MKRKEMNEGVPFLKKYSKPISSLYKRIKIEDGEPDKNFSNKNQFSTFEVLVVIIISVVFGIIVGVSLVYGKGFLKSSTVSTEASEIVSTYQSILDNYYDSVDKKELMNSAIAGMISSLNDPYSNYMNTSQTDTFNQVVDGSYVGIGATVLYQDGKFYISEMFDNSSAKKAGLKEGDIISKVGKKAVDSLSLDELSKLIKGQVGSKIKITVLRGTEEKTFSVKRNVIEIPSVHSKVIEANEQKIGYLLIDDFAANTFSQFESELKRLENKKIRSFVFDVRDNPGGHLSQVTDILDLFFDKKTVLYQIETKGKKEKIYASTSTKRDISVVILINSGSASAAEIFASSFQDNYKNAILVGTTTYGKGTIQKAVSLSSGASLKYTTQKWLTSKGKWLNEKGVIPDEKVEQSDLYFDSPLDENDALLQRALKLLTEGKKES